MPQTTDESGKPETRSLDISGLGRKTRNGDNGLGLIPRDCTIGAS